MSLIRSITTVGSYTVGSRFLGFVREVLTASFLGAGAEADALVVAIKLPSFFRRLFAEGAFNASFVPLFAGLLSTKGKKEAKIFASQVFSMLTFVLFAVVVGVELFLPNIVPFLVPGFKETPERLFYVISFTQITFPFIIFISLTALYSGILNSFDRFALVASSPMIGNLAIIAIVCIFHDQLSSPGYAFAWGIMICGIVQWLWVWIPALRQGMGLYFCFPKWNQNLIQFFKVMGPAAFGSGIVQINLFIGAFIASWLPTGAISYLNYADRLNQLPLSVIGVAVSTALLPLLSKQIRANHIEEAQKSQETAIRYAMFFALPAAMGLICLAPLLIMLVFEHGQFSSVDTYETARTLQAFALGLPAYIMIKVFTTNFFARQDTVTPIKTAFVGIIVDILLSIILMGSLKQVGIALATAVSSWINAFLLGYFLWKKGHLHFSCTLKTHLMRLGGACFLTLFVIGFLAYFIEPFLGEAVMLRNTIISSVIVIGLVTFIVCADGVGAMQFNEVKGMFFSSQKAKV